MRFRNKYNINLFENPLKKDATRLEYKNKIEASWYDDEARAAYAQLLSSDGLLPMDEEFELWFAEFYDKLDTSFPYDRDWAFFSAFPHGDNLKFLELGCGNGCLSRFFLRRGIEVHSIEISREYSLFLKKTNANSNSTRACAEILPYKNASFDVVTAFVALHHFNLDLCLPEIFRVLKPGGKGIFIEPLSNSKWLYLLRQYIPVTDNESPGGGGINSRELTSKLGLGGFHFKLKEYELFTRLERAPFLHKYQRAFRKIDYAILARLKFLRCAARTAVIEIRKPSAGL